MPNLTVRQMFMILSAMVLFLMLVIGAVGQYSASHLEQAVDQAIHASAVQRHQMDADMMHDAVRSDVLAALLAARDGHADRHKNAVTDIAEHAARLRKNVEDIETARLSDAARQQAAAVRPVIERYVNTAKSIGGTATQPPPEQQAAFERDFETLEKEMAKLSDLIQEGAAGAHTAADAAMRSSRWTSGGIIVLAIAVLALLMPLMLRRIVHPLVVLAQTARAITSNGDLTLRAQETADNEIGQTITAFNALLDSLQGIVREVRSSSALIMERSHGMAAASDQTTAASTRQSDASNSIAGAVHELSVSIEQMSDRSSSASSASLQSGEFSRQGVQVVESTAQEMRQIADAVRASSQAIQELGQNADQISRIVSVIKEIADQTNLLALNAAIEAARAGEQGRGFAVVADEVRKLAERTAQSTQEIAAMIDSMQSSTQNAVRTMDDGVHRVEMGVDLASRAGQTIGQVAANAGSAADAVADITHALREQNTAGHEIARRVEEVAQLAVQSQAAALDSGRHASELAGLAQGLDATVRRFRV